VAIEMTLRIWRTLFPLFSLSLILLHLLKSRFFRIFGRLFLLEHAAKISDNFQPTKFLTDYFQPMCKILPRIKTLAEHEGITIGALERIIGASKGVLSRAISNGTDIQSKWLQAIVENYPQYSAQWLLTGIGEMLNVPFEGVSSKLVESDPTKVKNHIPPTTPIDIQAHNTPLPDTTIITLVTTIQQQAEEIGRLKAYVAQLERRLQKDASDAPISGIASAG